MSCLIFLTAPVKMKVWSTMMVSFFRSASAISSSACATVAVKGFSTNTCFPFSSAFLAKSKCVDTGVITATASISGEVRISLGSHVTETCLLDLRARAMASGLPSHMETTLAPSRPLKFRTIFGPQ
jgi:hypothetical protein